MAERRPMSWHEEVLSAGTRRAAARLAPLAAQFYLAGGTGLALRLGHRISLDLDLFSREHPLDEAGRAVILEALRASGRVDIEESKDGTCHLILEGARVSLLRYPYRLLAAADTWAGIRVAAIEDIAAMKVSAIVGRGSKKDFVDLHEICSRSDLEDVLRAAARKYSSHGDFLLQAARALVYFEDAEKEPMPRLLKRIPWDRVKAFFEKEVPRLVRTLAKGR